MPLTLTEAEAAMLARIPQSDLEDLAVELDLLLAETFERDRLIERSLDALVERARDEGLPFTRYNKVDLEELSDADLHALASLVGVTGRVTPRAIIKSSARTVKLYRKTRPRSAVVLLLPILLCPLARAARSSAVP